MTDFTVESGVRIPDREKREAKRDLEQSIGDVTIDVDAAQGGPGGGGSSTASLAGGAGALEALDDQVDLLQSIHQELEKIGVSGDGGSGGGGSLLGGGSGFALGSALSGGAGGIAGTILSKGKGALGAIRGSAGLATRALGRSPYTMMAETWGKRDIASRAGSDRSGFVTGTMTDIATGEFQLKEDFWPDLSPPDNLWGGLTDALSPPDNLWGFDISPPDDLWGIDLSPPDNLWGVDLSPPDNLWNVDLSPPDNLWGGIDLSPPDGFWPSERGGSNGPIDEFLSLFNTNPQGETIEEGTQDIEGSFSVPTTSAPGDLYEGQPEVTGSTTRTTSDWSESPASTGVQEARVDVVVQEVAARIDSGRTLEDALRTELENVTPEIKEAVLDELRADMPSNY